MSRFTFVMFEGGGNVPAQLAIARRLVARGHAVRVLGDPAIAPEAAVAGCGFGAFASAPPQNMRNKDADRVRDWSVGANPLEQFDRVARELVFGPAEHYARDVLGDIEQHPADALAVDCLLFGALVGAERSGLPTAQMHHMPYSVPTDGVPPFGPGFRPARGPLGRLRDRVVRAVMVRMFEKAGRDSLNAARVAVGLSPLASVFEQWHRQDRVLVLTSPAFDFASRARLPENVVYCGPQLDDPAWVDAWTPPWPADAKEPLVLVALGSTFQAQGPILQRLIDALGTLSVRALVTLGGVLAPTDLRAPANVTVVASAPHRIVIPMASVVVAHGGHGTVMKALSYGKPVLSIPLGRDQADNAARVEVAGAGLRAKPGASVGRLRATIERLLEEPAFARGAAALATEIAADVAADRAVTELEALAQKKPGARVVNAARSLAAVALLAIAACGGGGGGGDGMPTDAALDAPGDATVTVPISDVECAPMPESGPGTVAEFQKHVLDPATFPDALCNDGTPAKLYYRPYNGAANRNKWILNLHGGGTCGGGKSCLARWCDCSSTAECPYSEVTTNFTRANMTNAGLAMKPAAGVFLRGGSGAETNPYGDYNQVELSYCTSDAWKGRVHDLVLDAPHPKTGELVTYRINFLGAHVLDADLRKLRQDGAPGLVYTLDGAAIAMPDLDEATEIIVTGDSAGGAGTISNLDYLSQELRAHNVACQGGGGCPLAIYGLIDAVVGPEWAPLDFGAFVEPTVRSYDQWLSLVSSMDIAVDSRLDASCRAMHAADTRVCSDEAHVIRNHLTTPFFVRMALRDRLISDGYIESGVRNPDMSPMTVASWALRLHDELSDFESMLSAPSTAEEKGAMTRAPGVFAPGCTRHDTIHTTADTYYTTITPPNGSPLRLFQVFEPWRAGTSGAITNLLTQSQTLTDTNCP